MTADYPDLLEEYFDFCMMREEAKITKRLDLSHLKWIYPSKLLPIINFIKNNPKMELIHPREANVKKYVDIMLSENSRLLQSKSYLHQVGLPKERKEANNIIERLKFLCEQGKNLGGQSAFSYFLSEMIDNIYDHSQFTHAQVFAQLYENKKFSEIAIIDDGISIQGSYRKAGHNFSDEQALLKALEGISTKTPDRGFGLRTNVRLFTEGLKGSFLIISGGAAVYITEQDKKVFKLQPTQSFQGTLITVRLPYPASEVNIYDFIE